jgi:hypothetical protein
MGIRANGHREKDPFCQVQAMNRVCRVDWLFGAATSEEGIAQPRPSLPLNSKFTRKRLFAYTASDVEM